MAIVTGSIMDNLSGQPETERPLTVTVPTSKEKKEKVKLRSRTRSRSRLELERMEGESLKLLDMTGSEENNNFGESTPTKVVGDEQKGKLDSPGSGSCTSSDGASASATSPVPNLPPPDKSGVQPRRRNYRKKIGRTEEGERTMPCRKSKRLLFRNTCKIIAEKNVPLTESETLGPYGRVVEFIDTRDMNTDDFVTKVLFLGNLDLSFKNANAGETQVIPPPVPLPVPVPKVQKLVKRRNGVPSAPPPEELRKKIFSVPSLKQLCVLSIVKRMRREYNEKELEYFDEIKMSDIKDSEELNLKEYMTKTLKKEAEFPPLLRPSNPSLTLEDCVNRLQTCGTKITFNNPHTVPKSLVLLAKSSSRRESNENETEGEEWFNLKDYMKKILKTEAKTEKKTIEVPKIAKGIRKRKRESASTPRSRQRKVNRRGKQTGRG